MHRKHGLPRRSWFLYLRFCHRGWQGFISSFRNVNIIDVLVGDYIAGHTSTLEVYVSDDLIKEVIDELEFLLLPEEEYEDEDRKYDEYKDDKLI